MNKKGISTIVATVLIVLITVAAVTILWAAISPMLDVTPTTACLEVQTAVKVDTDKTYTCFDAASGDLNVRIERSANTDSLEGIEIFVDNDGNTVAVAGANDFLEDVTGLSANGAKVYPYDNDTDFTPGMLTSGKIKVSVAPRVLIDGEETSCAASQAVEVRDC